jgi:hypothetical protein
MLSQYRKAIAGFVTPIIGWAYVVIESPPARPTAIEWVGLGVALATGFGVYAVPNDPPPGEPADPALSVRDGA